MSSLLRETDKEGGGREEMFKYKEENGKVSNTLWVVYTFLPANPTSMPSTCNNQLTITCDLQFQEDLIPLVSSGTCTHMHHHKHTFKIKVSFKKSYEDPWWLWSRWRSVHLKLSILTVQSTRSNSHFFSENFPRVMNVECLACSRFSVWSPVLH